MSLFLNKLYIIEENKTDMVRIKLNPNHEIFSGHFPDNPILPGVCVLQMVKEISQHTAISRIGYIRYYRPINPNTTQHLVFFFDKAKRQVKIFDNELNLVLIEINKIYYDNEKDE
jgi:3-hydroxymyristoyl/3-hydroxydecanoyl-(acyl carrier protein) dehydratase